MNIAIIDDMEEHLNYLSDQISQAWKKRGHTGMISTFSNVMELYPIISQYDIIFMDIKMPEKDGITAARELGSMAPGLIIVFISDYDSYVWNSFQADPIYFLRKSCLKQELPLVIEKCIQAYQKRNQTVIIESLHETYQCTIQDLYYVEAQGKYICLHLKQDTKTLKTTFAGVEKTLPASQFLKVHRSYLVNRIHIVSLQNNQLILTNDEILPVSKYRYHTVHKQYLMSLP